MKKLMFIMTAIITFIILLIPQSPSALESDDKIKVLINGSELITDVPPVVQNGRTLVPLRALFEALGINVEWHAPDIYAKTITKSGNVVKYIHLTIGEKEAYISNYGDRTDLDVPPVIINKRTMVPLRFIAEALDMDIQWDETNKTVNINTKEFSIDKDGFIVKINGTTIIKSDKEFLELKNIPEDSKHLLALGEDKKLYVVSKADLKYRLISERESTQIKLYETTYYNDNIYYVDKASNYLYDVIKRTDGEKETYLASTESGTIKINNRLYFTIGLGIKYIDMDIDKEFSVTDSEKSQLLYASKDEIFYYTYMEKGTNSYQVDFHLRTTSSENSDDDKVILSLNSKTPGRNYTIWHQDSIIPEYLRPDVAKVEDSYMFYDLDTGIYCFNPTKREFKKVSNIIARSIYYANNKLYIMKVNEIGYMDLVDYKYSKLFSKEGFVYNNYECIKEVDTQGNVTFNFKDDVGRQHFDESVFKYLIKENKLKLLSFTPGREFESKSVYKVGSLIDVDK